MTREGPILGRAPPLEIEGKSILKRDEMEKIKENINPFMLVKRNCSIVILKESNLNTWGTLDGIRCFGVLLVPLPRHSKNANGLSLKSWLVFAVHGALYEDI